MRTCSLLALTACVALITAHYSPMLAAQRDHRGFRASSKIQSQVARAASTHRRKGRRRWHTAHRHHAKHVKAVAAHYSPMLAAQRDHRGFRASSKIQSQVARAASTHRGKGRRRWHTAHRHHAKHVKAVAAHYSPMLAAQRDHRGFRASSKIQSQVARAASTHRGKGRRRWHSAHRHHAKHVKAVAAHYSPMLAAQLDHRGFRASSKIQSQVARAASTHRGKGRRRWHTAHRHHAKHVKAVLKTPYGGQ